MRPLKDQGLIEPEEERHQWVFHVMVSGRYTDWRESMMLAGEQPIPCSFRNHRTSPPVAALFIFRLKLLSF